MSTETEQLQREIAERLAKLEALKKPMTREEIRALAKTNPSEFNRRLDAGEIDLAAMKED